MSVVGQTGESVSDWPSGRLTDCSGWPWSRHLRVRRLCLRVHALIFPFSPCSSAAVCVCVLAVWLAKRPGREASGTQRKDQTRRDETATRQAIHHSGTPHDKQRGARTTRITTEQQQEANPQQRWSTIRCALTLSTDADGVGFATSAAHACHHSPDGVTFARLASNTSEPQPRFACWIIAARSCPIQRSCRR